MSFTNLVPNLNHGFIWLLLFLKIYFNLEDFLIFSNFLVVFDLKCYFISFILLLLVLVYDSYHFTAAGFILSIFFFLLFFWRIVVFFSVIVVLDYFIHSTDLVSLYPYLVAVSVAHVSCSTSCFIWNEKCDINKILV